MLFDGRWRDGDRRNVVSPRISDKGWIGQGSDQDLAELARLHALFDVEMRLGHHS